MNFVITMMAFVFGGILDKVAIAMNISVADSGLLNTMYAYGAAFGVPITIILFRKIERIRMLKIMLLMTILTTFALVFAQNFIQLLIVRLLMGIFSNSYGVLAIATIAALSSKERQGRSMAFLIMGSSFALVIGIPLTRALSSVLDWRGIFWILNGLMIFSFVYFKFNLYGETDASGNLNLRNEFEFFKDKKTLLVILYTLTMFVGYGAFFTYITPYLIFLFPSIEPMMSIILVLLGVASFLGNWIGGQVSDQLGYEKSLMLGAGIYMVSMLFILLFQPFKWLTVIVALIWIMSSWFIGLQLNTGIAQVTENKSSFMISVNSSSIQLGMALGASLAAVVITQSDIQNIGFIPLITGLAIIVIQMISLKKYPRKD